MGILLGVVESHSLTRPGFMVLIPVRELIALNINFTSKSFSDIDGTTAAARETSSLCCRRKHRSSATLRMVDRTAWLDELDIARNTFE